MKIINFFLLVCLLFLLPACANYKLHYSKDAKTWNTVKAPKGDTIAHTVFLIGDSGNYGSIAENPTLRILQEHLTAANENSSVI
ncbi:MAG: hypothetical protein AB8G15_07655, partial [Saprospiraceae bacterium]